MTVNAPVSPFIGPTRIPKCCQTKYFKAVGAIFYSNFILFQIHTVRKIPRFILHTQKCLDFNILQGITSADNLNQIK